MYIKLAYFKNGVLFADQFQQFNGHTINGEIDQLWIDLREKIKQKEAGNFKFEWKQELRKAFLDTYSFLR